MQRHLHRRPWVPCGRRRLQRLLLHGRPWMPVRQQQRQLLLLCACHHPCTTPTPTPTHPISTQNRTLLVALLLIPIAALEDPVTFEGQQSSAGSSSRVLAYSDRDDPRASHTVCLLRAGPAGASPCNGVCCATGESCEQDVVNPDTYVCCAIARPSARGRTPELHAFKASQTAA